ncbi:hypothetical protein EXIGLDRAFT_734280 [Exidia glandulosa HHB12029]|uniref:Uncharacterized protein n=1 Tax=Exidia glandulosa HHB12029 TaxID=1314781 RepID=A0A165B4I6_EXIGL|nr:hypothetical protein EXIGLDRAFT_734280 [Exidia glandulosa HHB12029]
MPNTRIPRSLVDLTLRSQSGGRTVPDFLALCHGHPLKHVLLESRVARWWTPVFDHMHSVASAAELWHFDRGTLRLDNGAVYTPYFPQQNLNLTDLATNLDSLASIVLEARDLPKQLVEVFRMPALRSITVHALRLERQ